jgi:hypothetical protein
MWIARPPFTKNSAWQGHAGAWPVTGGYCYLLQSLTTSSWHGELDMVPVSVSFKHVIA